MPLSVQIIQPDGVPMKLRWGLWHLNCCYEITDAEGTTKELRSAGVVEVTGEHKFTDPADGEVLIVVAGSKIEMWR